MERRSFFMPLPLTCNDAFTNPPQYLTTNLHFSQNLRYLQYYFANYKINEREMMFLCYTNDRTDDFECLIFYSLGNLSNSIGKFNRNLAYEYQSMVPFYSF